MPSAKSHIPEKRRIYQGEEVAEALINWLNHTKDDEAEERIERVIRIYLELWFHTMGMKKPKYTRAGEDTWYEHQTAETKKRDELQETLNKALSYYRMVPRVYVARRYDKRTDVILDVLWGAAPGSVMHRNQKEVDLEKMAEEHLLHGAQMGESGAIRNALELIKSNYIFRVRRCRCEKFFFQRFVHQRFCSEKCRLAEFRTSDEARHKRNEYARKLYRLHQSKSVK
jgi:hypothetical protein